MGYDLARVVQRHRAEDLNHARHEAADPERRRHNPEFDADRPTGGSQAGTGRTRTRTEEVAGARARGCARAAASRED